MPKKDIENINILYNFTLCPLRMAERICLLMIGDVYTTSSDNLHVYVTQTTIQLNPMQ